MENSEECSTAIEILRNAQIYLEIAIRSNRGIGHLLLHAWRIPNFVPLHKVSSNSLSISFLIQFLTNFKSNFTQLWSTGCK